MTGKKPVNGFRRTVLLVSTIIGIIIGVIGVTAVIGKYYVDSYIITLNEKNLSDVGRKIEIIDDEIVSLKMKDRELQITLEERLKSMEKSIGRIEKSVEKLASGK